MKRGDIVKGYYEPTITNDISDDSKSRIGNCYLFEVLWLITEDDNPRYVGQRALRALDENGEWIKGFFWVPQEDVRFV